MLFASRITLLAARLFPALLILAVSGCSIPITPTDCGSASAPGPGHHGRILRRGKLPTLPPPVPSAAVAAPIARYHPLPVHPVFEPQPEYKPMMLLAPRSEPLPPEPKGEPTPAAPAPESGT